MPSRQRLERIADRIQEVISEMLVTGQINDPRLEDLYITDVTVDRELTFANIFVSALSGKESSKEILGGLEHASGYLRSTLARQIELRTFPQLRFFWDETPERAERIEKLIDSLNTGKTQRNEQEN